MDLRFIQNNMALLIWLLATALSILLAMHLADRKSFPDETSEGSGLQPSFFKRVKVLIIGISAAFCMAGFAYFFVDRLIKGLKRTILNNPEWADNMAILAFIVPVVLFLIIACYIAAIEIFTDSIRVFRGKQIEETGTIDEAAEAMQKPELIDEEVDTEAG